MSLNGIETIAFYEPRPLRSFMVIDIDFKILYRSGNFNKSNKHYILTQLASMRKYDKARNTETLLHESEP